MLKGELRQQIREMKRQLTRQQREELSLSIVTRIRERVKDATTIMAYYPLPDEVDIRQLLDELVAGGKTVLLPRVTGDETMELRVYTGPEGLSGGAFHILEPVGELFTDYASVDIILVPGLAFDALGHRLGRGRGYYDRFLITSGIAESGKTIGICFDFQKVAEVPVDEYDIPLDEVI